MNGMKKNNALIRSTERTLKYNGYFSWKAPESGLKYNKCNANEQIKQVYSYGHLQALIATLFSRKYCSFSILRGVKSVIMTVYLWVPSKMLCHCHAASFYGNHRPVTCMRV